MFIIVGKWGIVMKATLLAILMTVGLFGLVSMPILAEQSTLETAVFGMG